jgi:hypothetical protein
MSRAVLAGDRRFERDNKAHLKLVLHKILTDGERTATGGTGRYETNNRKLEKNQEEK